MAFCLKFCRSDAAFVVCVFTGDKDTSWESRIGFYSSLHRRTELHEEACGISEEGGEYFTVKGVREVYVRMERMKRRRRVDSTLFHRFMGCWNVVLELCWRVCVKWAIVEGKTEQ